MKNLIFTLFALAAMTSSCTKTLYFTQDFRGEVENMGFELENIQFYNDREILLKRVLTSKDQALEKGKITTEKGKQVEIISIPVNTAGICIDKTDTWVKIKFEQGENRHFTFLRSPTGSSYQISNGREFIKSGGTILYADKQYDVATGYAAKLRVKKKKKSSQEIDRKKVKGIKVGS